MAGVGCAQDFDAALERVPLISAALLKALEGTPPFLARAEVQVTEKDSPQPTTASGMCAWQRNTLRWDINLSAVRSPLLPPRLLGAIRRFRLDPIVLLARGDAKASHLLLHGAKASLETALPKAGLARGRSRTRLGEETLDGQPCAKEKLALVFGKHAAEIFVWTPVRDKAAPVQVRINVSGESILVRFRDARAVKLDAKQFQVPSSYEKYTSPEDLAQSILWEQMKSKVGGALAK